MSDAAASPTKRQIYKVALASIVGSVIEQYDFLVTGVIAATIWGGIFFKLPGLAAVAAAIGVYGIGIIIRPIGAYIFGNIADRRGRKNAMVYALVLMGISTLLIGLTPTYDSIGVIAPGLLIVFRLMQGISFGGEFGTASTWVVEQAARSKHRAFWGAPPLGAAHFRAAESAVSVDPETRTSPSSRRAKTAHPRQTLGRRCERRRSWRNVRPTAHAVDHFPRVSDSATVPERGNIRCDVEELCRIAAMHHYVNLIPAARIPLMPKTLSSDLSESEGSAPCLSKRWPPLSLLVS
jgi:hypothetical protein